MIKNWKSSPYTVKTGSNYTPYNLQLPNANIVYIINRVASGGGAVFGFNRNSSCIETI